MWQSDSDSEYNDPDMLYSDADAIAPEADKELTTSLQPCTRRANAFQSLGINVVRLLLTYLNTTEMMSFTSISHWLRRIGTGSTFLAQFYPVEFALYKAVNLRVLRIWKYRELALSGGKREIQSDWIFDGELTNLIHAEEFDSRTVYFSLRSKSLIVWECEKRTPRIIMINYVGVQDLQDFTVNADGIALLGSEEITNIIVPNWESGTYQSGQCYNTNVNGNKGVIRRAKGAEWVALAVQGNITVFTLDLVQLYYFPCCQPVDVHSKCLFALSTQSLLYVTCENWQVYNLQEGVVQIQEAPVFEAITKGGILTVPNGDNDARQYIITLGSDPLGTKLYADLKRLETNVKAFHITGQLLITLSNTSSCTLYKADSDDIFAYHIFSLNVRPETLIFRSFQATPSCLFIAESSANEYIITFFSYTGDEIYYRDRTLNESLYDNGHKFVALSVKSDIIIKSPSRVRIIRYLLDEDEKYTDDLQLEAYNSQSEKKIAKKEELPDSVLPLREVKREERERAKQRELLQIRSEKAKQRRQAKMALQREARS